MEIIAKSEIIIIKKKHNNPQNPQILTFVQWGSSTELVANELDLALNESLSWTGPPCSNCRNRVGVIVKY